MPRKVLVVEDDPALSDAIREGLSDEGIQADVVSNVRDAIDAVKTRKPDAVVLDLMLGNESGMDVLKSVRASRDQTPILILSALGATENRVAGLHEGADDYLVKPFEMKELHARLVAITRRGRKIVGDVLTFGPLRMELTTRRAFRDNKELKLSPTEISLLELFIRHENQILTRKMLYHHLWDTNWESETNVIEVHINRLRSKVDKGFDKPLIHTLRGRGYILSETVPAHRETIETESDAENT
ncbi:MAG: response regulator transcription factor [Planctomycetota bacterium]|jgi:two-component system OmpR family response regulator